MNEAYEAGTEVALQEIAETLGADVAEKVAMRMPWAKKTLGSRVKDGKKWLGKKTQGIRKHISANRGKYSAGAGVAGGVGGKVVHDRYS